MINFCWFLTSRNAIVDQQLINFNRQQFNMLINCWSTFAPKSTLLLNCYLTIASQSNLLINSWSTKLSWSKLNNSYSTCWSAPEKQHVTQQLINFTSKIQLVTQQLHNMLHQPATGKLINSYSTLHPRTPSPRKGKLINSWSTLLLSK